MKMGNKVDRFVFGWRGLVQRETWQEGGRKGGSRGSRGALLLKKIPEHADVGAFFRPPLCVEVELVAVGSELGQR